MQTQKNNDAKIVAIRGFLDFSMLYKMSEYGKNME